MVKVTFLVPLFLISTQLDLGQCIVVSQNRPTIKKCCPEDQQLVVSNNTQCKPRSFPSGLWPLQALDLYSQSMLNTSKKNWRLEIGFPDCATEDLRHTHYVANGVDSRVMPSSDGQLYLKEYHLLLSARTFCVDETEQDGFLPTVIRYCFEEPSNNHKCCPEGSVVTLTKEGVTTCDEFSLVSSPPQDSKIQVPEKTSRLQITYASGLPACSMYQIDPEKEQTNGNAFYFLPLGQLLLPSMDKNPNVITKEYCIDYVLEDDPLSKEMNAFICFGAANAIYPCLWLTVVTAIFGGFAFHL